MTTEDLPPIVAVIHIAKRMHWSESKAYEALAECARIAHGREAGSKRSLRVRREAWLKYENEVILCGSTSAVMSGGAVSTRVPSASNGALVVPIKKRQKRLHANSNVLPLIQPAQPKTKPRLPTR